MKHDPITTVTVPVNELRNALNFARAAACRRSTIPVLSRVKMTGKDGALTLAGTDLDVETQVTIEAETTGELRVMIDPMVTAAVLSGASGRATIAANEGGITIENDGITATFTNLLPVEDWPELLLAKTTKPAIELGEAELWRALNNVTHCISTEETRYYLSGICFDSRDGQLVMVATDGHRLGVYRLSIGWSVPSILPRKAAALLQTRLRMGGNQTIRVSAVGRSTGNSSDFICLIFEGDGWRVASKLIDGTFPDWTRVVPKIEGEAPNRFTLALPALNRIPNVEMCRGLRILPAEGVAEYRNVGDGFTARIPCQGEGGEVGFNASYLRSFARTSPSGAIRVSGQDSGAPHIVHHDDPLFMGVIMPMRL